MTDLITAYINPDEYAVELLLAQIESDDLVDEDYARDLTRHDPRKITPIIVIKHPLKTLYAVLDGHHRFRAAKLRGLDSIRAVIVDDYTGLGFDLTRRGFFQPSPEVTKYIRVPFKKFAENMLRFLSEE
jgi:hypothetical protein